MEASRLIAEERLLAVARNSPDLTNLEASRIIALPQNDWEVVQW